VGKNLLFLEETVRDTGRILYRNAMNVNIRNSFRRRTRKTWKIFWIFQELRNDSQTQL